MEDVVGLGKGLHHHFQEAKHESIQGRWLVSIEVGRLPQLCREETDTLSSRP